MLELESLSTIGAFESSQDSRLIVADHMSLKSVDVCKVLLAHLAPLKTWRECPVEVNFGSETPHRLLNK